MEDNVFGHWENVVLLGTLLVNHLLLKLYKCILYTNPEILPDMEHIYIGFFYSIPQI